MLTDYSTIGIFFLLSLSFPLAALGLAALLRPKSKFDPEKIVPYECGVDTKGRTWVRFKVNYFLYALVFLAFEVETIFLFPWAVKFNKLGIFAFVEMIIFLIILLLALFYAWKEGALKWY
ncbi:NADH-quinone oxidoreductase subunit A [Thermosyntropha sp.]|uniref:NADH-quinone oxidoreductase subunit A n=1 Tax=Thermosyntropha sp. TaxID=2740820 RepID=UPI0025E5BCA0|nr:NADH-quinone oxidoreductase subunit A [Thermosyntropha sp.]MBO8159488.1 NADH-quinone oxidoreductase subunit A [Thermosyntropha sp.]